MNRNHIPSKAEQVRTQIQSMKEGTIFFPDVFENIGQVALHIILSRLVQQNRIIRLGPGLYLHPRFSNVLGTYATPSLEDIATAIAMKERSRIIPTGSYALYKLGLTMQAPTSAVFLTDGSPRKINLEDGRIIVFKRTTAKNLSFHNPTLQLLVSSIKEIGNGNITPEHREIIQGILSTLHEEELKQDLILAPYWVRELILHERNTIHESQRANRTRTS
ncbi:DUF6088 family protein [uncultured Sphaerochaeta sp.]|uniref:DUF6088 family protein n=1 Tax=uncultured Sphaerochaeta sp. TaxID=886478 RepID=UPI002A0A13C7|nr:DUF6088 family protein [uncultured Sphaerochaeta sp.]